MAYVIPNTTCKLYSGVEAIPGEQNLYFSSVANKNAYFNNKLVLSGVDMTYQRKGLGRLRIEASIATVRRCNYITFVNTNHENVVFYAFIFDYEYYNEGCTEVSYIIDEWLTNCHDANMTFSDCVIEREHNNLAEYNAERANPYRNDMPSLKAEEPMTVGKLDELPPVLPIINIMESGAGLDSNYSYTYSGPFSNISDKTDYPKGQNMCYVVLFAGQLEPEESKAVLRCADYMHAPSGYTKVNTNYSNYLDKIPELFKMFTDFDVPHLRDGVVSPFYVGIYDMVEGNDEEHEDGFEGSDIVDILNWFTLNDAVSSIVGIYMMPRYMVTWDYQVKETTDIVSATSGNTHEYTITKNKNGNTYGCYIRSELNPSLPEVVNNEHLMTDGDDDSPYNIYMPLPTKEVENYKLKRFPYSYIRAVAPDSTTKEFYYEEFYDIVNAQTVDFTKNQTNGQPNSKPVKFRCVTNMNGQPTLSLVPHNYKLYGTVPQASGIIGLLHSDLYGLNEQEKLEFNKYPQLGFMSDGYVSYLAAQYNQANQAKSTEAQAAYNHELTSRRLGNGKEFAGNVGDIVSGATMIGATSAGGANMTGGGIRQIAQSSVNLPSNIENMRYTEEANEIYKQRMAEADMRGNFNGNIYDTLYNGTKPTFVGDSYTKGDAFGYGMYQFYNINAYVMGFTVQVVELKPNVLALYDNFLTNYGYAVNRIGLPHVYEAIKGMAGKTLKFNSKNFVYVKTSECKVSGLIYESCKQIADMFNNGIKFINGDPS